MNTINMDMDKMLQSMELAERYLSESIAGMEMLSDRLEENNLETESQLRLSERKFLLARSVACAALFYYGKIVGAFAKNGLTMRIEKVENFRVSFPIKMAPYLKKLRPLNASSK